MPFTTARRPDRLTVVLILLTGVTGVVEAVSYLGLDRLFTAVMTGNILFVGFGLVDDAIPIAGSAVALVAFSVGALASHRVNGALARRHPDRWLTYAVCGEGVLIMVAALIALGLPSNATQHTPHRYAVIVVLALAMGSRNTTVLLVAARDLPTTVVTRALAGLFMLPSPATAGRRFATVAAMFAGALIGALLLAVHPAAALAVASAVEILAGALCPRTEPQG
ncbi:YoaK family protein [Nonomuraea sp. LPB2021202275-12-8]|uniref:YoaK family protein n=1 Tax=Nonomuraea sp. LPB2021202275-12-8 TaxID=3120159 RepID=UPI00300D14E3